MKYPGLDIKSWAEEDRPREKLMLKGKSVLTDAELIGILIGSGTRHYSAVDLAKLILKNVDNDLNKLARLTVNDLKKIKGIGQAKAITIVSAFELGRRRKDAGFEKNVKIISSQSIYELMKPELLDLQHEEFWLILLNRANILIKKHKISIGGITNTIADPKIIFKTALEYMASSFVLIHNHPSSNLQPSKTDIQLTKNLVNAGKFLELPVLDHLIFTDRGYFSFKDEDLI